MFDYEIKSFFFCAADFSLILALIVNEFLAESGLELSKVFSSILSLEVDKLDEEGSEISEILPFEFMF